MRLELSDGMAAIERGKKHEISLCPGGAPRPDEKLGETDPEVLSLGLLGLDTNRAPNWPGLQTRLLQLLQQLPPQDSDVGSLSPASLFSVGEPWSRGQGTWMYGLAMPLIGRSHPPSLSLSFHIYIMAQ